MFLAVFVVQQTEVSNALKILATKCTALLKKRYLVRALKWVSRFSSIFLWKTSLKKISHIQTFILTHEDDANMYVRAFLIKLASMWEYLFNCWFCRFSVTVLFLLQFLSFKVFMTKVTRLFKIWMLFNSDAAWMQADVCMRLQIWAAQDVGLDLLAKP